MTTKTTDKDSFMAPEAHQLWVDTQFHSNPQIILDAMQAALQKAYQRGRADVSADRI
jgi:hypothetical protein